MGNKKIAQIVLIIAMLLALTMQVSAQAADWPCSESERLHLHQAQLIPPNLEEELEFVAIPSAPFNVRGLVSNYAEWQQNPQTIEEWRAVVAQQDIYGYWEICPHDIEKVNAIAALDLRPEFSDAEREAFMHWYNSVENPRVYWEESILVMTFMASEFDMTQQQFDAMFGNIAEIPVEQRSMIEKAERCGFVNPHVSTDTEAVLAQNEDGDYVILYKVGECDPILIFRN